MAFTLIDLIRDNTTDDAEWLPDAKINEYLAYRDQNWLLATADCLRFMARDDRYEQYSRGGIKASKPLLMERAKEFVAQNIAEAGVLVTQSTLVRTDYQVDTDPEYTVDHPPYELAFFMKDVKEKSH
jgi:hypothetical protein